MQPDRLRQKQEPTMPLPVLPPTHATTPADLLRYLGHAQLAWSEHLVDPIEVHGARLFIQPQLPNVPEANCVLAATADSPQAAQALLAEVESRFSQAGAQCQRWVLDSASPATDQKFLETLLLANGFGPTPQQVMHLTQRPPTPPAPPHSSARANIKIIPARAAYRHLQTLIAEQATADARPGADNATLLHLDDSHYDALLAIANSTPLAFVGVLNHGEIAALQQLFVSPAHRHQGLGTMLVERALESCARAQSRHVIAAVDQATLAPQLILRRAGFQSVGRLNAYTRR
jgi:GNAT superfamily N-acetyltransferase